MGRKQQFVEQAKPLALTIEGLPLNVTPTEYSTGSIGFNIAATVPYTMPDGSQVNLKFNGNLVVEGSKKWAA